MPAIAELDDDGKICGVYDMRSYTVKIISTFLDQMSLRFDEGGMPANAMILRQCKAYMQEVEL